MAEQDIALKSEEVKFLFKRSDARKAELRRLYDRLISRARGREFVSGLHERHHIQPRCLGGSDESGNIAILTFGEHFLTHYLLALTTEGEGRRSMLFALNKMAAASKTNKNRIITRQQYEIARKAIVEASSGPEHGEATSAGMARRKEELGPEEYAAWCAEVGKASSAGQARRKAELDPEEYSAWCAERGKAISAGMARRKEELGPEAHGKATSAGMLKNSPPVRCLNDGKEYENAVAAAKFYGLRSDHIHAVCQGRYKTTGGLRFEYVKKPNFTFKRK